MNGFIRIGVGMDDHKFNAQYKELKYKIEEAETYAKRLSESMVETRKVIQTIGNEISKANKEALSSEQIVERIKSLAEGGFDFTYEFEQMRKEMGDNEAYLEVLKFIQEGITEQLKDQNDEYTHISHQIDINKEKIKALGNEHHKLGKTGTKSFESLFKGAKKLALGIIGAYSLYSMIHKAASSYMSTDTKLTKQIEANWVGLGVILEPAIKLIIDLFKKAVTGILYFMSVLTGVDYIAKANALALKKQEQATKDLTKANDKYTASFDELNIAQDNSSQSSITDGIDTSVLFNLNDLSKSTIETIEKIAEKLKPVYNILKDIIDWASKHPDIVIAILGGVALLKLLNDVMGIAGVSGLLGIQSILLALAAIGIISIGINVYQIGKTLEETKQGIDNIINRRKKHLNEVKEENKVMKEEAKQYEKNSEEMQNLNDKIQEGIIKERNYANSALQTKSNLSATERIIAKATGEWDAYNNQIIASTEAEFEYLQTQKELYEQGKLNEEQIGTYQVRLKSFTERLMGASKESDTLRATFIQEKDAGQKLGQMLEFIDNATNEYNKTGSASTQVIYEQTKATNNLSTATSNLPERKSIKIESSASEVQKAVDNMLSSLNKATKNTYTIRVTTQLASTIVSDRDKAIMYIKEITGMATGGIHIVNNPGKGVISGNVKRGEAGAEGIIPLTDESAMRMLGESIGKYVTIYATMINQINGRTLSKEMKQIMNQSDFASNV